MKLLGVVVAAVVTAGNGYAQQQDLLGTGFVAPQVDSASHILDPQRGEIVWDFSATGFVGFNGSTWQLLGAENNAITTEGDIVFGGSGGVPARLPGNETTTKKYLTQTGDGTNSSAPTWDTIPAASATESGLISTGAQTFAGDKTFTGSITANIDGASTGNIRSGTYTPTTSGASNISGVTARTARWTQVGNVVTVHGAITVTETTASNLCEIRLTKPIAATLTAYSLSGNGVVYAPARETSGVILTPDTVGGLAETTGTSLILNYTFSYTL